MQPGADVTQRIVTEVVTFPPRCDLVLLPGRRTVILRDGRGLGRIRKMLGTGQRRGVHPGLQLTLHEVRLADVDDQGDHDEHHPHGQSCQHENLP